MLIATCKPGKWQDEGKKQKFTFCWKLASLARRRKEARNTTCT